MEGEFDRECQEGGCGPQMLLIVSQQQQEQWSQVKEQVLSGEAAEDRLKVSKKCDALWTEAQERLKGEKKGGGLLRLFSRLEVEGRKELESHEKHSPSLLQRNAWAKDRQRKDKRRALLHKVALACSALFPEDKHTLTDLHKHTLTPIHTAKKVTAPESAYPGLSMELEPTAPPPSHHPQMPVMSVSGVLEVKEGEAAQEYPPATLHHPRPTTSTPQNISIPQDRSRTLPDSGAPFSSRVLRENTPTLALSEQSPHLSPPHAQTFTPLNKKTVQVASPPEEVCRVYKGERELSDSEYEGDTEGQDDRTGVIRLTGEFHKMNCEHSPRPRTRSAAPATAAGAQ